MKIAFRADGNKEIGLGHLYRCRALAEALSEKKAEIVFLTKTRQEAEHVLGKNVNVIKIKNNNEFIDFLAKEEMDVVVTDNYKISGKTLEKIKTMVKKLAYIADLNPLGFYPVDIIVNQNIYAPSLEYNCPKETLVLAGTRYAMLRKEFRQIAGREKKPNNIPKILVSFGGTDSNNLTVKAARALKGIETELEAVFVLGKAFSQKPELEKHLKDWKNKFKIYSDKKDMALLMFGCDFALSAAGTTTYELAFCGVPTITISQAENQYMIATGLEKAGFSVNLGKAEDVLDKSILEEVKKMLQNKVLLEQRSKKGKQLVDGLGAKRVANEIMKGN